MSAAIGFGGWLLAVASLGAIGILRIQLARHLEAVALASHELRGPLTAVRLALALSARARQPSPSRLRAIELELGRAALALEDLSAMTGGTGAMSSDRWRELVDVSELVSDSV